uniref:C-type lectin domain-containing protein n=1 Tax=Panagrolaimus sp. PS1159 TaxID=55785 RepID=A0AC35GFV3_9BILA
MVAEEFCIHMGGHLVSIHDALIDALLAQEGANHFLTDFWIGLTDLTSAGNWSWMDGTVYDFKDWEKGEPKNIIKIHFQNLKVPKISAMLKLIGTIYRLTL